MSSKNLRKEKKAEEPEEVEEVAEEDDLEMGEDLPREVLRRVNALRRLQHRQALLDIDLHKEIRALDAKFAARKQALYDQRFAIISGAKEPSAEECVVEGEEPLPEEPVEAPTKGVPQFWSTVLQGHQYVAEMMEEHDLPVLEHLEDVRVENFDEPKPGYRLRFVFSQNEFFTNKELVKTYFMTYDVDPKKEILQYSGPVYESAQGCEIDWKEGKNVTVRIEKKKQKKKGGKDAGKVRTISKTVPQNSFFHFFKPSVLPENPEEDNEEQAIQRSVMEQDFQIGDTLRERVIPHAALYFTGEMDDNGDGDDFGEEFGEDGEYPGDDHEDDDDEDDEEDEAPKPKGGKGGKPASGKPPGGAATQPECKQQ